MVHWPRPRAGVHNGARLTTRPVRGSGCCSTETTNGEPVRISGPATVSAIRGNRTASYCPGGVIVILPPLAEQTNAPWPTRKVVVAT